LNPTLNPTSAPTTPAVKHYNGVGYFEVTSITPTRVSTTGGDQVAITGNALETEMGVRVGPSGTADGVVSARSGLTFRTPALIAGTYDVTIYKNGRFSTLPDALTYSAPGASAPGTSTPPAPGSTPAPSSSSNPTRAPTTPAGGGSNPSSSPTAPGTDPPEGGGTTPTTPNATRTGPNGEHLVRNDALAALTGLWALNCTTSCTGLQV
jgi:hypothetical protein